MIAPGLSLLPVHALLHHGPMTIIADKEAMQVKLNAVLHGRAIHLGYQPAGAGQIGGVESHAHQGRLARQVCARMLATSAADMDAELACHRREACQSRW
jgi:hypothetical protein